MKGGFRNPNAHPDFKENIVRIVSREARGFLLAGFFGGLCGGIVGSFFAYGVGRYLEAVVTWP